MQTTEPLAVRIAQTVLIAVAILAYSPEQVKANEFTDVETLPQVLPIPTAIVFATADLIYGVREEWLPPGWAITQLVIQPILHFGAVSFLLEHGTSRDGIIALAVTNAVLGVWFLSHSILSLVLFRSEDEKVDHEKKNSVSVNVGLRPIERGAAAALTARF